MANLIGLELERVKAPERASEAAVGDFLGDLLERRVTDRENIIARAGELNCDLADGAAVLVVRRAPAPAAGGRLAGARADDRRARRARGRAPLAGRADPGRLGAPRQRAERGRRPARRPRAGDRSCPATAPSRCAAPRQRCGASSRPASPNYSSTVTTSRPASDPTDLHRAGAEALLAANVAEARGLASLVVRGDRRLPAAAARDERGPERAAGLLRRDGRAAGRLRRAVRDRAGPHARDVPRRRRQRRRHLRAPLHPPPHDPLPPRAREGAERPRRRPRPTAASASRSASRRCASSASSRPADPPPNAAPKPAACPAARRTASSAGGSSRQLGSTDSNPRDQELQRLGVLPLHHSPELRQVRISLAARWRYAADPMADGFTVLIMAAGRGTRMRSALPKVLHPVCGKPMLGWVVDAAREAGAARVLCVTRPGDGVAEGRPRASSSSSRARGRAPARPCWPLARSSRCEPGAVVDPLRRSAADRRRATSRGLVDAHEARGRRRHAAHHRPARPDRLRPRRARRRRRRRPHRRDQTPRGRDRGGARRPRDQPRHLRVRRGAARRGARRGRARAGRALPARRDPDPARARAGASPRT